MSADQHRSVPTGIDTVSGAVVHSGTTDRTTLLVFDVRLHKFRVEKYRPVTMDDAVLHQDIISTRMSIPPSR